MVEIKELTLTRRRKDRSIKRERYQHSGQQYIRSHALKEWTKDLSEEKRGSALRRIQSTPSQSIQILHKSVKRFKSSLITKMRIDKTGLKAFLYSRRVSGVKDEQCECDSQKETIRYILIECNRPTFNCG